jgi:hypothetical protein
MSKSVIMVSSPAAPWWAERKSGEDGRERPLAGWLAKAVTIKIPAVLCKVYRCPGAAEGGASGLFFAPGCRSPVGQNDLTVNGRYD